MMVASAATFGDYGEIGWDEWDEISEIYPEIGEDLAKSGEIFVPVEEIYLDRTRFLTEDEASAAVAEWIDPEDTAVVNVDPEIVKAYDSIASLYAL